MKSSPQSPAQDPRPASGPARPTAALVTYEVAPFGNRFRVLACRGTLKVPVTSSVATEAEAQAAVERLTERQQELNQR